MGFTLLEHLFSHTPRMSFYFCLIQYEERHHAGDIIYRTDNTPKTHKVQENKQESELQIRCVKLTSIISSCVISSLNPIIDHLLESSQWDDSNKWSNIGFGEEIGIIEMKLCSLSGALYTVERDDQGHR